MSMTRAQMLFVVWIAMFMVPCCQSSGGAASTIVNSATRTKSLIRWHEKFSTLKAAWVEKPNRKNSDWSGLWWKDYIDQEDLMARIQNAKDHKAELRQFLQHELSTRAGGLAQFIGSSNQIEEKIKKEVDAVVTTMMSFVAIDKPIDAYFVMHIHPFDGKEFISQAGPAFAVNLANDVFGKRNARSLQFFLAHEIFHVIHLREVGESLTTSTEGLLMREGLAVLATKKFYPAATDSECAFMDEKSESSIKNNFGKIASEMLESLNSGYAQLNETFFSSSTNSKWPPRSGYYVGFKILERLASRGTSLYAFMKMDKRQYSQMLRDELMVAKNSKRYLDSGTM